MSLVAIDLTVFREPASTASPSPIEGAINEIEYGHGFSRIVAQTAVLELL
jgi:hypothetical protein